MTVPLTLGSLFDGIGGFPLAGVRQGFTPVWASEIELFPMEVTKIRFPDMLPVGDIMKLKGSELIPVDVVCGGSPCQDLSVANGRRLGLQGERSGLFMEQIRIIKEMRAYDKANGRTADAVRPRYMVWENVPGAFSCSGGEDFRAVLEETCRVADNSVSVPRPPGGVWQSAGAILGDQFSVAWRVYDAQYWNVPQRRKRIFLVADFGGRTASQILFEQDRLLGDSAAGEKTRQGAAPGAETGAGASGGNPAGGCLTSWDVQSHRIYRSEGVWPSLYSGGSGGHGYVSTGTEKTEAPEGRHVAFACNQRDEVRNLHDVSGAIQAQPGMKQQTFVAEMPQKEDANCLTPWDTQQGRVFTEESVAPTLAGADGGSGRNPGGLLFTAAFSAGAGSSAGGIGYQEECAPTLKATASGSMMPSVLCLNDQGGNRMDVSEDVAATLRSQEHGHSPLVMGSQPELFENYGIDSRYRWSLPATLKQKLLIADILARFPDSDRLFEYEDYQNSPTMENASEMISAALDQNLDQLSHQEVYVNYIATRPRAEKVGVHGLFSDEDTPLVLSQVAEEAARHTGNIWTPIISLRREDAARLGYDNAAAWMALLRKQRNMFAEQMKIAPENLRWYAAFHNEGHHPHCHMIVYSVDPREGYVTKPAIEKMRSSLAREIFQQDLLQIYSEQTERRDSLTAESRDTLRELLEQMRTGTCANPVIEDLMSRLAERLKYTTGKKQYGYLKAPLKELVNQIVDELAKDERVAAAYAKWQELRNEVLRTYKDQLPEPLPLSQQKEFKQIKNMVIAEAVSLGSRHVTFEGDANAGPSSEEENATEETEPELPLSEPPETVVDQDGSPDYGVSDDAPSSDSDRAASDKPHIAWNDRYKEARAFLFGSDETEPDFEQALRLFREEAEDGNALAMHDLGRMYADGLGVEIDAGTAFGWYAKALSAFEDIESVKENRYVEYRIGKMYAAGLGAEQDYEAAAGWFGEAVAKRHKYAQYSLAGLYFRGQGVKQSYETAFSLYMRAAVQHMPYADYELAKMYRDGVGTSVNSAEAARHFKIAFQGFQQMEKQSRDDKLQYRLGQMLYTGTGTEKDVDAALGYFEKSARLGNVHAQYMLGRIYLDADSCHENAEQAVQWLTKSADGGNALAQYALGKLYRDGNHVEKDIRKAIAFFTSAAEQDNSYAAYALGKLYLQEESIPKDVDAAVKWLGKSANLGNQFAQYALAKLYLCGEDVPKIIPKALELFQKSAAQGNSFAQYRLGRLYLLDEDIPKNVDVAIRWLTASAEQGNQYAQYALGKLYLLGEDVPKGMDAAVRWLTASAEQGNQYAQYALGKLYLAGSDIPRDREAAIRWLTLSAEQGNIYARFFLDHPDSFRDPSLFLVATRLLHHLSRIFREEQERLPGGPHMQVESKLRRKIHQKKIAQGHAPDDHEQKLITY